MQLTADDRVWVSVPLFWSYGAVNAMPATLTHQAALVLQEAFEPGEALDLIEEHGATAAYTLPNMTNALVQHPAFGPERTRSLRTGLTLGGADDIRRAAEVLGAARICNIYGSTEVYGNCCVTPADWPLERKAESQGPPLPGVELRIRDPETNEPVAAQEPGELHVTGYVTCGYLGADAAANAVFGADGWYRTGDLGFLDEQSCFHFVARATEMIKTGGINVAPGEVEEFLMLHDKVRDAAVVGVEDRDRGEAVVAFVVQEPDSELDAEELRAWCRQRIASFKVPVRFHVLEELPKTDTGKLARRQLPALDLRRETA
jgi:fatty-acyl-CoA synthase